MQALSVHLLNIFLANLHVKLRCIRCEIFRGSIFFSQNVGYETDISLKRQITFAEAFFFSFPNDNPKVGRISSVVRECDTHSLINQVKFFRNCFRRSSGAGQTFAQNVPVGRQPRAEHVIIRK